LSQEQIREQILERFGMVTASRKDGFLTWNPLTTGVSQLALSVEEQQPYRAIVGSINYVVCVTRPNLAFSSAQLLQHTLQPTAAHMVEAKRCLWYMGAETSHG
jgi:hypothetical protein